MDSETGARTGIPEQSNWLVAKSKGFSGAYGTYYEGEIPITKVYNAALTAKNVELNYIAYKIRFSI